ncbi:MAG: hypothetical protein JNN01_21625 [Opitutaceae bacterium]|nr:hypothetical protein [Opitutaceae bacterium]
MTSILRTSVPSAKTSLRGLLASRLVLGLALAFGSGALQAQTPVATATLTFEDLGNAPFGVHMPATYGGLVWGTSNWHFMTSAFAPTNNYLALSGTATALYSQGGADFYFEGANFWSRRGLDATGSFYFVLHRDGVMVYNGLNDPNGRQVFDGASRYCMPNYAGPVDTVAIAFAQGGGDWDHLAMDDVRIVSLADGAPAQPFVMTSAAYSFSGGQTVTGPHVIPGLRYATFSGQVQNRDANRVDGTLTFTVEYRVVGSVATVSSGRWTLTTSTRDRPSYTAYGTIAAGYTLAANATTGALAAGNLRLAMLFSDPAWPISATFNVPMDSRGKLKGNFTLVYPYIP